MTRYLRVQALIALSGILLFVSVLASLSRSMTITIVPEAGGTYIEGVLGAPTNLNPLFLQNQTDRDIAALVFSSLTRASTTGQIEPELAERWEIDEESAVYTFHLRDDVFWHDGEPFSADDVAFTMNMLQDPTYLGDQALAEVWRTARVEIVDPLTVRITLPEPYTPFLSFTTFGILPAHLLEGYSAAELPDLPFSQRPVGTGPWRIADSTADSITLQASPEYYGPAPVLDKLIFRFYLDAPAMLRAYRRSEIMGLGQVFSQDVEEVAAEPNLVLWNAPRSGFTGIVLNLTNPLFADTSVRQALLYGMDRQAMIGDVLNGQGLVANSFIVPTNWAYNPGVKQYTHDRRHAQRLLNQAGWVDEDGDGVREKDGKPFSFTLVVNEEEPQRVRLARAISARWLDIGVNAEVVPVSFTVLTQDLLRPRFYEAAMITMLDLPPDSDPYPLFHSSQADPGGSNFAGFRHERADRLMVEGRQLQDEAGRRELYFDFQELFAEQLPILPLYHPVYTYAVDGRVREVQIGPLNSPADRFRTLPDWFIKTRRIVEIEGETASPLSLGESR